MVCECPFMQTNAINTLCAVLRTMGRYIFRRARMASYRRSSHFGADMAMTGLRKMIISSTRSVAVDQDENNPRVLVQLNWLHSFHKEIDINTDRPVFEPQVVYRGASPHKKYAPKVYKLERR